MSQSTEQATLKPTTFTCCAPNAERVVLAGSFNNWQPDATPMVKGANGYWSASLELSPGRYEFKFVVDGVWCCEPGCDDGTDNGPDRVPNEFGTLNRVIEVT